jgi:hypothetical protein
MLKKCSVWFDSPFGYIRCFIAHELSNVLHYSCSYWTFQPISDTTYQIGRRDFLQRTEPPAASYGARALSNRLPAYRGGRGGDNYITGQPNCCSVPARTWLGFIFLALSVLFPSSLFLSLCLASVPSVLKWIISYQIQVTDLKVVCRIWNVPSNISIVNPLQYINESETSS